MNGSLIKALENEIENPRLKYSATLGFDGFVDSIIKLVHHHDSKGDNVYFDRMKDWGTYITDRVGKNFSVELTRVDVKFGGNMPIMANALANLGLQANCIGAMGYPEIQNAFHEMSRSCNLMSFAPPGITQALEFDDGKIMLGNFEELNKAGWDELKNRIGKEKIIAAMESSSLICLVNWGELEKSNEIWSGLIHEILPECRFKSKPFFFFDLSDFSKKRKEEINEVLNLLKRISGFGKAILGLNQNEAHNLFKIVLNTTTEEVDLIKLGQHLFERLEVEILLLHSRNSASCIRANEYASKTSMLVEYPKLLTGAGDNFNAAFCYGHLLQLDLENCLTVGHAAAHCYIRDGVSPTLKKILNLLKFT